MTKRQLLRTAHSVSELRYHIIFCTKYRRAVLVDDIKAFITSEVHRIVKHNGWVIHALAVQPEHVHVVVSAPPCIAPMKIAAILKGQVAFQTLSKFPALRKAVRRNALFSRGTYYGSVGNIGQDVVQNYVERQR